MSARAHGMRADALAGLTTAVMLIPQSMAYAMLAGLPPIVGLYASTLPLIAYALVGSSRELAVGPVAMDSLLVASALAPLAAVSGPEYVGLAVGLALLVGAIQVGLGLLRAGAVLDLLKRPAIAGFTSAAAIIIGLSQLSNLLGVPLPRTNRIHELVAAAVPLLTSTHWPTLAIGLGGIALLLWLRRVSPRLPRALIVVVVGSVLVWLTGASEAGVAIVGAVPAGLPELSVPTLSAADAQALLPSALVIALVAFMEGASVGKALADRRGAKIKPSREFIGLGLANLGASVVGGYPVAGGFSRTAVNAEAGARSRWAGVITAGVVVVTLLFFTGWFFYLPKAALASIIMASVFGLIDIAGARRLWATQRLDFALFALTFAATLGLGIEIGIGIGFAASLALTGFRRWTSARNPTGTHSTSENDDVVSPAARR